MSAWLLAFACGLGAGIVSAWGVGGGTLLLVLLTLVLHVEQRTAQGINLLFFLPTAAAALVSHARGRPAWTGPPCGLRSRQRRGSSWPVPGSPPGIDVSALRRPFACDLLLSGISLLLPRKTKKP